MMDRDSPDYRRAYNDARDTYWHKTVEQQARARRDLQERLKRTPEDVGVAAAIHALYDMTTKNINGPDRRYWAVKKR